MKSKEEFVFYFGPESPFSHWFHCDFKIDGQSYCCVEQYLMYKKAKLFRDEAIAVKILKSSNPAQHRYLGREVRGFDKALWQKNCKRSAFEAEHAKFSLNPTLKELLLRTTAKSLAESSPYDRIWGIGLSAINPKSLDRKQWRGRNWSGEVLESVRLKLLRNK